MYLDVGVERVQRYLTRTPQLKGLRGASAWLSHTTRQDKFAEWVPQCVGGDVDLNDEAGEADGVVPLRLPAGADPAPAARQVMAELRARLPAGELRASWFRGPSYVEAYRDRRTEHVLTSAPPPSEFAALESCQQCRADPAVEIIDIHGEPRKVCADCDVRYQQRYRRPGLRRGWVPVTAERHLLEELYKLPTDTVATFNELAELGDAEGNRNHLATVCADGNAMGELFGRVAASGDPRLKKEVSRAVSKGTRDAWHEATQAVTTDRVAVIPHVAGGDDLIVSVVADRAWRFVRIFLNGFGQRMAEVAPMADGALPSASAGVVFAHATFPFPRATELAQDLLREAKQQYAGRHAAVAWLDVTREGDHPPPARRPWLVTELDGAATALRELRRVEASGRAVMERLIDPAQPAVSLARLRNHARRLERGAVLEPFLEAGDDDRDRVARVADALALARWWR
jgi:hypothetical protein